MFQRALSEANETWHCLSHFWPNFKRGVAFLTFLVDLGVNLFQSIQVTQWPRTTREGNLTQYDRFSNFLVYVFGKKSLNLQIFYITKN